MKRHNLTRVLTAMPPVQIRNEFRVHRVVEGEAIVVNRDLVRPEPRNGLANVLNRLADRRNDHIARLREPECRFHIRPDMRNRSCRGGPIAGVDLAVVNAADPIDDIVILGEPTTAHESTYCAQGHPPYACFEAEQNIAILAPPRLQLSEFVKYYNDFSLNFERRDGNPDLRKALCGCDADCGHEGMSASIVAGMDASPVLDPAEHVFDLVPLAIENAVMFDRLCAVGP